MPLQRVPIPAHQCISLTLHVIPRSTVKCEVCKLLSQISHRLYWTTLISAIHYFYPYLQLGITTTPTIAAATTTTTTTPAIIATRPDEF